MAEKLKEELEYRKQFVYTEKRVDKLLDDKRKIEQFTQRLLITIWIAVSIVLFFDFRDDPSMRFYLILFAIFMYICYAAHQTFLSKH